jgi:hypothetical protein
MEDNGYRIIKFNNGDTLICKILEVKRNSLIIERPMQYKIVMLVNNETMNNTEMLVFKPWIDQGTDQVLEIKSNNIITVSKASEKLVICYEMEKKKEDNPVKESEMPMQDITDLLLNQQQKPQINTPPDNINITFNVPPEMAEEIVEMMAEAKSWEDLDDEELEDEDLFPEVKPPKKKPNKKKPNSASKQPPQKKNKKDNKNFGNDWSDWSPDPKDYI